MDCQLIEEKSFEINFSKYLYFKYGHLEWMLKLSKFAHLRDNADFPQVITQCLNESYTVLYGNLQKIYFYSWVMAQTKLFISITNFI